MRRVHKNLCPATISASVTAVNMWKNSLKNVESDNNNILYKTLLNFFYSETVLTFWISLVQRYTSRLKKMLLKMSMCGFKIHCCRLKFLEMFKMWITFVYNSKQCFIFCCRQATVSVMWQHSGIHRGTTPTTKHRAVPFEWRWQKQTWISVSILFRTVKTILVNCFISSLF